MRKERFRPHLFATTLAVLVSACGGGGAEAEGQAGVAADQDVSTESSEGRMFQGLRTVVYEVDDLQAAKDWYSKALGIEPYFDEPFYVGFSVGGYELGLHPADENTPIGLGGTAVYWGVDDIEAAVARLTELGATVQGEIQDVGDGIMVSSMIDPFGNLLGVIRNPYFKLEP